jgi:hypothetical protein
MTWADATYGYKKKITIDYTKVVGDEINFPVLISVTDVNLADTSNGGHVESASGYDICFYDSIETTLLYHEIERYVNTSGLLVFWVNIPSISSTTNTIIYIYYGKSGVIVDPSSTSTWDTNYKMVQHMKDTTTSTTSDSTSYGNNGEKTSANNPPEINGKIGKAQDFDGSNDIITVADSATLSALGLWTVETWYYGPFPSAIKLLVAKDDVDNGWEWQLGFTTVDMSSIPIGPGSPRASNMWVAACDYKNHYAATAWHHILSTWDGVNAVGHVKFYIDGALFNDYTRDLKYGTGGAPWNSVAPVSIGGISTSYPQYNLDGILDEVRISNIVRTATWISTEYNNQNAPADFYDFDIEEEYGITPPVITVSGRLAFLLKKGKPIVHVYKSRIGLLVDK